MDGPDGWGEAPSRPRANPGEVHAWRIGLGPASGVVDRLAAALSIDERARADRFRSAADRVRFVVGRGALRAILGRYLDEPPDRLAFEVGPNGKPALVGPGRVEFNLTHAGGYAVLAVAAGRRVGVDIEPVRPVRDLDRLVERFFSAAERSEIASMPAGAREAAFFRAWTSKEAYLKATGLGLSIELDSFDVSADPDAPPVLRRVAGDPGEAGRWTLRAIRPAPGYLGAVAAEGDDWGLVRVGFAGPWAGAGRAQKLN